MRRLVHGLAALLLVAATSLAPVPGAAQGIGSYTGVASADAYRATVEVPGFLIVEKFVDGGGPSAQAAVDSSGGSSAFAAAPDPGELVVALPGLVSILTGIPFPFTAPVYVSTQHPTNPADSIDQPGYHIASTSDATKSTASARFGERTTQGVAVESFAESETEVLDDGTVVATSSSGVGSLRLGALEIAGFRSTATVTRKPNEEPVRDVSMEIGRVSIAGVPLTYDSEGLTIGEQSSGDILGPVLKSVLETAGITLRVLEPVENADGVVAPGLLITTSYFVEQISSDAVFTLALGQASAAATAQAFPLPEFDLGDDLVGSTEPPPTPPPPPPSFDVGGAEIPVAPPADTGEVAAPAPQERPQPAIPISTSVPLRLEGTSFYLVLLGAAALLAVLSRAFTSPRRARWNS